MARTQGRVGLVCMPFADTERPAAGISLLKAELLAAGVTADPTDLNVWFARTVGLPGYRLCPRLFPGVLSRPNGSSRGVSMGRALRSGPPTKTNLAGEWKLPPATSSRLRRLSEKAEAWLDRVMHEWPWVDYDVVGFTSFTGYNPAALALARRIKQTWPDTAIVFGGRNWEGVMGQESHHRFPFVDYVCPGEADIAFTKLVRSLLGDERISDIGGVLYRRGSRSVFTGPERQVARLDGLPVPEYDDYFRTLEETGYSHQFLPALPIENSRGCWWAARTPCAFCGLNGGRTTYRAKSGLAS